MTAGTAERCSALSVGDGTGTMVRGGDPFRHGACGGRAVPPPPEGEARAGARQTWTLDEKTPSNARRYGIVSGSFAERCSAKGRKTERGRWTAGETPSDTALAGDAPCHLPRRGRQEQGRDKHGRGTRRRRAMPGAAGKDPSTRFAREAMAAKGAAYSSRGGSRSASGSATAGWRLRYRA